MTQDTKSLDYTDQLRLAADYIESNDLRPAYDIIMPLLKDAVALPGLKRLHAVLRYKHGCIYRDAGDLGTAISYFSYAYESDHTLEIARNELAASLAEWERTHKEMLKKAHGWWMPVTDWSFGTGIPLFPKHRDRHVFEMQHISAMIEACEKRRRAIDIGGHIGSWSWVLADHFNFVEAFEPNPIMQTCFRRNVDQPNVNLHPVALGRDEGRFGFVAKSTNTGNSHIAISGEDMTDAVEVKRLDSHHFDNVDFIKMDAEGFESFIIAGGVETLTKNRPIIFMEVNGCAEHYGLAEQSAIEALQTLGANIVGRSADGNYMMKWND